MRVGVVPQGDNLDPDFTVQENLLVFARYFGIADAIMERIPSCLNFPTSRQRRMPALASCPAACGAG
jgi:lipooligosaccharide transport system ATP-binding protein